MIKAKISLKYDSTPDSDTWWEAWKKYSDAKKKFERAVYNLDKEGMEQVKEEIKKAWKDEEYEISLKTMDQIFEEYRERLNR